jgi:hypothetical protein
VKVVYQIFGTLEGSLSFSCLNFFGRLFDGCLSFWPNRFISHRVIYNLLSCENGLVVLKRHVHVIPRFDLQLRPDGFRYDNLILRTNFDKRHSLYFSIRRGGARYEIHTSPSMPPPAGTVKVTSGFPWQAPPPSPLDKILRL